MRQKLDRSLGLYSAITMSVGTMIGSAIFVLAGTSYDAAGPSASLAVLLAGIAALFTAFSFSELVTFIPTSGGGYAYVRDATDKGILGFMTGWGFWLGYAMSGGLFALGFGSFLNFFFPFIPQMLGAYILIIYITFTNIKGVEGSGKLQNIITTSLLLLLVLYTIYGYFHLDLSNQTPYFTEGLSGTFTAMGFLYITYIGYGLVTTASEEVINPQKTIPRAIMISLLLVTVIKTLVFFVGSSIINWEQLIPTATDTPLINTAIEMAGSMGGYLFALAGILATVSSINTSMMAASRTSFAMARDRDIPSIFKNINPKTKTPIFSILVAGLIVVISTSIRDLEHISTVTSIFALSGYTLVNVAVMIFRKKRPDAERTFKVPFYPLTPILGIMVNIFLVFQLMLSDFVALSVALIILGLGIAYYYLLLPKLKKAPKGLTPQPIPDLQLNKTRLDKCYRILIPVACPDTAEALINFGLVITEPCDGDIIPMHVMNVPRVIPLDSRYDDLKNSMRSYQDMIDRIDELAETTEQLAESLLIISRDSIKAIKSTAEETGSDIILMGWHCSGLTYRMLGGMVHKALEDIPKTVGILKRGTNKGFKSILYPYGGGPHSQAAAHIIRMVAESTGAKVTLFRVISKDVSEDEYNEKKEVMHKNLKDLNVEGEVKFKKGDDKTSEIIEESQNHDLLILGVSSEWGIKDHITGSTTDQIMEKIECSGLIVREYLPLMQKKRVRDMYSQIDD